MSRIFLLVSFLSCSHLYSAWDLSTFASDPVNMMTKEQTLANTDFIKLKREVLDALKDSWCSAEKANLIMDLIVVERPEVCVEIGVFTGASFLPIVATLKYLQSGHAYAIDPWTNSDAVDGMEANDPNKQWWKTLDMQSVYNTFMRTLKKWKLKPFCTVLKMTSAAAAKQFNKIDFLHMDGNYTREHAIDDVFRYLPKVKKGGYILFSNLLISVNDDHPKMDAFDYLLESCEYVCDVDNNNCMLLRKFTD